MRAEAGIDHRELFRLRIVNGHLARVLKEALVRHIERIELG
jgi:hypothetical protein